MPYTCTCCGHPSAKKYSGYKVCSMCEPHEPVVRTIETHVNDKGTVRKAKVRETTYKCESELCDNNKLLSKSVFVIEWLE